MSSFVVSQATAADFPQIAEVLWDSFRCNALMINSMYPGLETAEGRNIAAERMRLAANADPTCTHLKIVDQASGKIVGQGKWYIRETDPEPAKMSGPYWKDEEQRQFTEALVQAYFVRRRRAINETTGRVYCAFHLGATCVSRKVTKSIHQGVSAFGLFTEYQRRGGGRAFMQWGVTRADAEGAICVVEGDMNAVDFYRRFGFVALENVNCDDGLSEKWRGRATQKYVWMIRQPQI
ncbi:MAG: hypothetical protein TREMPRED_003629 [Tremellales sp. Tagirdzhanova-0007]|nr:MAG: hypothetical protein TREMPRED_003629 [Tremellales sp. Tagirdzhanova-0007]